ncbi:leucyl aminopeptidase [Cetobacterium sp. SF1]|uniref:leucyl aminopeptidase n=1 Tax=Cetobacterium sp. SF1 TaxID=3417654 RepID=UPI003CF02415
MFKVIDKIEKPYDENLTLVFQGKVEICPWLSEDNRKLIEKVMEKEEFNGEKNKKVKISFMEHGNLVTLTYVGCGKKEEFSKDDLREVLFKSLNGLKGTVLISSNEKELRDKEIYGEIVYNVNYSFDRYIESKSNKIDVDLFIENLENKDESLEKSLGEMVNFARNLVDEPANVINPETLALRAENLGKECGFEVEIFDEYRVAELGMEAFLAVARASKIRPRMIVMRYMGDKENKNIVGLVGKGLTYDTGGLCLKTADGMLEMKTDMGGAATVIGTMGALAKNKVKKNVVAVVAACENAIGSNAYRPGDIIKTMNGKTIEIINTDAEGRVTLADALTYIIREEKVTEVIDIATLTGGVMVALGTLNTGLFSNNDEMADKFLQASKNVGEKYWRLPLNKEYGELIKSNVADIKNSAGRWASSITASKFLEEFVEGKPWIHLDIAGTAYLNSDGKWLKKGATGVGVRTIFNYVINK